MGFPLILIGLLMIVTGARGTYAQFGQQIASEFQGGKGSFTYWLLALIAVGSLGYVSALQNLSRYLLALVILSIFLSHKGFFAQFKAALQAGPTAPNPVPGQAAASQGPPGSGIGSTVLQSSPGMSWSDWLTTLPNPTFNGKPIFGGSQ